MILLGTTINKSFIFQNGIEVANAVANIALNNDNKLVSFGNNFVSPSEYNDTLYQAVTVS